MFLDAAGHDANCAFAGDPRAKCTCGGKKAKPAYKPLNLANDDSGLAALAGDLPRADMVAEKAATLQQQVMVNKNKILDDALVALDIPRDDRVHVTATRQADGSEIYAYKGKNFLIIHPLVFDSALDGDAYKITARQSWNRLDLSHDF